MAYPVIDIEGIGETYAAKLEQEGIHTTGDLLEKAGKKAVGRRWRQPPGYLKR